VAAAAAAELLSRSLDRVSTERLTAHTRELARWTKHAGTPGELKSLAYVERALASYGYRTELIRHDAYISLPGAARLDLDDFSPACITHSFSRPTPPGGLELPLVGADGDPRGAAVLVDGIATPGAVAAFATSGAAAQIHISPDEHLHEMCVSPVWGSPSDDRLGDLPQTVVLTVARADGERLRAAAVSGTARVRVVADVDTAWRPTPILVAELAGPDEPFVLFSGHHDTWYVGAMDNGGANATMLEVARVSALERAHWRRGLRLAFWSGHSQGRYSSSAWYADHHWEELEARAVAHVNVDSTGGCGNTVVANATASAELGALAREAIAAQAGQEFAGDRMHRAGDQSFWGIGVPAIFGNMGEQPSGAGVRVGPGTGWWWHTPDDTLDKIDSDLLLRDTRIYQHVVWRLLADPVPPLDYAESARQLARTLDERAQAAGSQLDLAPVQARVRELEERAARFGEVVTAVAADRSAAAAECLRRVSRAIVPVDHTSGDRFAHDPALAQGPLPALAGIDRLGSLDPAGDDARFLISRLVRECNRVSVALRDAVAAFDAFLAA
jgi:hypothetical protein